jgi:hypothetical protein
MSDAIQFHSRVGDDGVLHVQVNLGRTEASKEVVVTVAPLPDSSDMLPPDSQSWQEFVVATYGSCAGLGLERPDQGEFEVRESIE